jgi:hypothetical protein
LVWDFAGAFFVVCLEGAITRGCLGIDPHFFSFNYCVHEVIVRLQRGYRLFCMKCHVSAFVLRHVIGTLGGSVGPAG